MLCTLLMAFLASCASNKMKNYYSDDNNYDTIVVLWIEIKLTINKRLFDF